MLLHHEFKYNVCFTENLKQGVWEEMVGLRHLLIVSLSSSKL